MTEEGAAHICEIFRKEGGCLIGRNGSTELQTLSLFKQMGHLSPFLLQNIELYSGIFPQTAEFFLLWIDTYKKALKQVGTDPAAMGWFRLEAEFEKSLLPSATQITLRSLEPYYVGPDLRWTKFLAGKKVAVVSSFAETIRSQIPRAAEIWGSAENAETLLPSTTEWFPIQTGFPPSVARGRCEWPDSVKSWKDAIRYLYIKVMEVKPDFCIIGCGALGMILGAYLKKEGIKCVIMGGATQVLFGIKGSRWQEHNVISKFWNSAWVWPADTETPAAANKIEKACYWK